MLPKRQYKIIVTENAHYETCVIKQRDARYFKWSLLPEWLNPYQNYMYITCSGSREDAIEWIEEDKVLRLNPHKNKKIEYFE